MRTAFSAWTLQTRHCQERPSATALACAACAQSLQTAKWLHGCNKHDRSATKQITHTCRRCCCCCCYCGSWRTSCRPRSRWRCCRAHAHRSRAKKESTPLRWYVAKRFSAHGCPRASAQVGCDPSPLPKRSDSSQAHWLKGGVAPRRGRCLSLKRSATTFGSLRRG